MVKISLTISLNLIFNLYAQINNKYVKQWKVTITLLIDIVNLYLITK